MFIIVVIRNNKYPNTKKFEKGKKKLPCFLYINMCNQKEVKKNSCIEMMHNTSTIHRSVDANDSNYTHHKRDIHKNIFLSQTW
jgi:hypothetical protein